MDSLVLQSSGDVVEGTLLYWDTEVTGTRRIDLDKDGPAVTKCLKNH